MSNNPKSDNDVDWPDEMTFSGATATMHPNGATDFGIGKNISSFSDSIGGCNMDFAASAKRGYTHKADDARDIEFKCIMKVSGIGNNGFSISFCTGHHTGDDCCQGFAYMLTTEVGANPTEFLFRKETTHVNYEPVPGGAKTHSKADFEINGAGKFVGLGACRYNKPTPGGTSPQDDHVVLEAWFNPDPDSDPLDWTKVATIEDKPGFGWTDQPNKCNGDDDQIGPWSGAQNRMKTNAPSGSIIFKSVTLREIDPLGTFEEEPGGGGGGGVSIPSYVYESKFGTEGTGNGQFLDPHDITFDASGNGYVCDRERNDVQKFTHTGTYISKFGGPGSGNGQFNVPYAIQFDPTFTYIYVMDRENNRVQKLDASGTYISKITSANGQNLNAPEDICFDASGNFYICDTGNNRIVEFNSSHTFIREWGSQGDGNGQFNHPHSMDIGLDGNVYINSGNQAYIQVFSPTGTFIRKFGSAGTHDGELLTFLEHMDIDYKGRLHIINNNVRPIVSVFDCATGNYITKYGSPEKEGSANGQFKEPEHVTTDIAGKPYVVDAENKRIQIFSVNEPTPTPDPDPGGGGGSGGGVPAEPSKVKGTFTLMRDINIFRTDACEGTGGSGGGGGGGGRGVIYDAFPDHDKQLADVSAWTFRTRVGEQINKTGSGTYNKIMKQLNVPLKRVGSPASSPGVTAVIWDKNGAVVYTSPTVVDPSTLPTSFDSDSNNWEIFDFSANTHVFVLGDRWGVRYYADSATSDVNYVVAGYEAVTSAGNTTEIQLESGVWHEHTDRDFACIVYD